MNVVEIAFLIYCGVGVLVFIYNVRSGRLSKIDSSTVGASQPFFVLIAPSFILLWPLLKISQPNPKDIPKNKNSRLSQIQSPIWVFLSLLIFAFMIVAVKQRPAELNSSIPLELVGK